jgi:hypothetical protein
MSGRFAPEERINGNFEFKSGPTVFIITGSDCPFMAVYDFPANRQPQAGTAGTGFSFARLHELIENAAQFIFRYTYALIDNLKG